MVAHANPERRTINNSTSQIQWSVLCVVHDFIIVENSELWNIVLDGSHVPMNEVKECDITRLVSKTRREHNEVNRKKVEKTYRAKKLLVCRIRSYEYNNIFACESAKEIKNCLRTTREGTAK